MIAACMGAWMILIKKTFDFWKKDSDFWKKDSDFWMERSDFWKAECEQITKDREFWKAECKYLEKDRDWLETRLFIERERLYTRDEL